MKVFLSVASLAEHYGGPARSVLGLAKALAQAEIDVGLWAADGSPPLSFDAQLEPSHLKILQGSLTSAITQFGQPDIFHDNGLWWAHNRQIARLGNQLKIPRMVSLRGMIEPWAMQHKRWKKVLAWRLYQHKHLQMAACLHGTADKETTHARALGLSSRCFTIPNGISLLNSPAMPHAQTKAKQKTALFLGRLHPVKGLEPFIEAWARVRPQGWSVKLAGPDENGYQSRLQALMDRCNVTAQFEFLGSVDAQQKTEWLTQADLLIQPSYSENFGMSIAEALASSVPVLTTTGTPWEKIAQTGCGWWVPLSIDNLEKAIAQATSLSSAQLQTMGKIGSSQVSEDYSWSSVAQRFSEAYEWVLSSADARYERV